MLIIAKTLYFKSEAGPDIRVFTIAVVHNTFRIYEKLDRFLMTGVLFIGFKYSLTVDHNLLA